MNIEPMIFEVFYGKTVTLDQAQKFAKSCVPPDLLGENPVFIFKKSGEFPPEHICVSVQSMKQRGFNLINKRKR